MLAAGTAFKRDNRFPIRRRVCYYNQGPDDMFAFSQLANHVGADVSMLNNVLFYVQMWLYFFYSLLELLCNMFEGKVQHSRKYADLIHC